MFAVKVLSLLEFSWIRLAFLCIDFGLEDEDNSGTSKLRLTQPVKVLLSFCARVYPLKLHYTGKSMRTAFLSFKRLPQSKDDYR